MISTDVENKNGYQRDGRVDMSRYVQEVAEMDRRRARTLRLLSVAGMTALVFAALWSAGLPALLWTALQSNREEQIAQPAAPAPTVSPQPAAVALSSDPTAAGGASSLAPQPQPLLLVATSPGKNKREGTAGIGVNAKSPQTYVAGAVLVNGARLTEIHADHVVLERDGERLQLFLSGSKRNVGAAQLGMAGGIQQAPRREEIVLAEDHLTDVLRSMPHYDGEQLTGLQVFPGQFASAFAQLGLRAGDIVTAINGSPVAEQAAATDMLRTLTEGAAVTVSVRRGPESKVLSLDGSIVVKAVAKPDPATLTAGAATL